MIIKNVYISGFGKLYNENIGFNKGLNVVYGPNESGKSTLRNYIFTMLYGGISQNTKRTLYNEEYNSSIPWSGINFEGSMDIEYNGEPYHLYRNFVKGNERFTVINTRTGEDGKTIFSVDESRKVERIDRDFFGINENTLRRNFIIDPLYNDFQNDLTLDVKDRLSNKIKTNVDSLSLEKLITNIDLANEIKSLQREEKSLKGQIIDLEIKLKFSYSRLEHKIDVEELDKISKDINSLDILYKEELKNNYNLTSNINSSNTVTLEKQEYIYLKNKLINSGAMGLDFRRIEELINERKKIVSDIVQIESTNNKNSNLYNVLFVLSIFGSVYSYFYNKNLFYIFLITIAISLGSIISSMMSNSKNKKILSENYLKLDSVLSSLYNSGIDPDLINDNYIEGHIFELKNMKARVDELEKEFDFEITENEDYRIYEKDDKLDKLKNELDELIIRKERLLERIKIQDEYFSREMKYKEELDITKHQLKNVSKRINLIEESKGILKKISKEQFINHAGELSEMSSYYLKTLTDKKYTHMIINPEGKILIKDSSSNEFVDVCNLSKGTIDQVYLAYRLAIIDGLSLDFPLFIDDGLVLYDDERNFNAIKLISELSNERQIIMFTSHDRDIRGLNKLGANYNLIELGG